MKIDFIPPSQDNWVQIAEKIASVTNREVELALGRAGRGSLDDLAALLSPAADAHLARLADRSRDLTRRRFGHTMQMYVPLYLSNECTNVCTYCGFSVNNKIERTTLDADQIRKEVAVLKRWGYDHVLVVTGESPRVVTIDYLDHALSILSEEFSTVTLEVQPLATDDYRRLRSRGLHGVLVYQETYNRLVYEGCHPKGKKANFDSRIDAPSRAAAAGLHRVGLGILLGLADWRVDLWFLAQHLSYLRQRYWQTKFTLSLPRLRPAEGFTEVPHPVSERQLLQAISAFRLFDEALEISLSTRERPAFRDLLHVHGVTATSAGSRTEPGGYTQQKKALRQFEVSDERSPDEVARALIALGLQPIWKDWDSVLNVNREPGSIDDRSEGAVAKSILADQPDSAVPSI